MTAFATPIVEAARLILREPRESDLDATAAFYASDRSRFVGGPVDRTGAWRFLIGYVGHWVLRGYGFWTVEDRETGAVAGRVGIVHHDGWPEPELCWHIYDGFEGRGVGTEAVLAARAHAQGPMGLSPLMSLIDPANARSLALARRVGAAHERDTLHLGAKLGLWRHPAGAA
ncbi:MAG: GNAT family N-acetyltransferase [Paracoccaceae bacterium]